MTHPRRLVALALALALGPGASAHATSPPRGPTHPIVDAAAAPRLDPAGDLDLALADARALVGDEVTGDLTNGKHYHASNERDLHLVRGHVSDLGGLLVAVAADPGYVLAAWMDADAIVFVDLDPEIIDLHAIYAAFLAAADTPADFLALWGDDAVDRAHEVLAAACPDPTRQAALLALHEAARPAIARRLADLARRFADQDTPWFGGDPALYRRLADLARAGRIVALRADLTRDGAAADLAALLARHQVRVDALYLSNIEQYFLYTEAFRATLRALPFAPAARVLRTLPGRPAGFEYIVQGGRDFQVALADPRVRSVYRIRGFVRGDHLVGRTLHEIPALPR